VGGGGLVVVEKKCGNIGEKKLNDIEWKYSQQPEWWI
jgi:hypothetical protein